MVIYIKIIELNKYIMNYFSQLPFELYLLIQLFLLLSILSLVLISVNIISFCNNHQIKLQKQSNYCFFNTN